MPLLILGLLAFAFWLRPKPIALIAPPPAKPSSHPNLWERFHALHRASDSLSSSIDALDPNLGIVILAASGLLSIFAVVAPIAKWLPIGLGLLLPVALAGFAILRLSGMEEPEFSFLGDITASDDKLLASAIAVLVDVYETNITILRLKRRMLWGSVIAFVVVFAIGSSPLAAELQGVIRAVAAAMGVRV